MTNTIEKLQASILKSYSATEYAELLQDYSKEGKTTGEQKDDLIYYTKLNAQRSKRIAKTVTLNADLVDQIKSIKENQNWVLITESWCGDAANGVPVLSALAELNNQIDLRIVLRDSNLELMDDFLTNGGRSIPKLIVTDDQFNVQFTWGPRPKIAQELYDEWRKSHVQVPYKEFQVELQKWYNQDAGKSIQDEIRKLLQG